MTKCAVVNKDTTVVENIIMASPSDPWPFTDTFLVLVPDDLPVDLDDTYVAPNFYDHDGSIVKPITPDPDPFVPMEPTPIDGVIV